MEERDSPTPWAAHFHPCQHKHLNAKSDWEAKLNLKKSRSASQELCLDTGPSPRVPPSPTHS